MEIAYALQNGMTYAALQNQSGQFVLPTMEATSLAGNASVPDDLRAMIVNTPDPQGYPIAGFTWLVVYQEQDDPVKGKALVEMLWWILHEGQELAPRLDYAPCQRTWSPWPRRRSHPSPIKASRSWSGDGQQQCRLGGRGPQGSLARRAR